VGLTIHYQLRTNLDEPSDVAALVASLKQAAGRLPFRQVGPVVEFRDAEADFGRSGRDDEYRWLKIQASRHLEVGDHYVRVTPRHIIAFKVDPGAGCEPAHFGFCRFPPEIDVGSSGAAKRRQPTGLAGWSWSSFCKTQYASNPDCGGVENFLRCHVGLVRLLDRAAAMDQMTVEVEDESGYWQTRDPEQLVNTVGDWNQFIAAFAGSIKDLAEREGVSVASAIADFPNFEHLEARGADRLRGRGGD
jgi:hypothetical protein